MKFSINLVILPGLLFLSNPVLSEETNSAQNPWSVSLLVGSSDVQLADASIASQSLITSGIEVGYNFNQNLGLKFGSQAGVNFGRVTSAIFGSLFNIEIEDYSYHRYYFAATAQTEGDVHLFGSLGFARLNEEITITNSSVNFDTNSTEPYWEIGVGWNMSEHFGVGLSYSDTDAKLAKISTTQFKFKFEF